ncbi:DUF6461 domain-containing protein [Nonomuraea dietziae]|uniref:DUF6461 domain-containing protein n=1 Tax=Nonomuraea dietziae TaxID=65515 RepID=UPI0033CA118B
MRIDPDGWDDGDGMIRPGSDLRPWSLSDLPGKITSIVALQEVHAMVKANAATYEWLYQEFTDGTDETWLCACFVRDVAPNEALRRIDVVPGSPLIGEGFGVAALPAKGGTVLIEYGWGGVVYSRAGLLSAGSTAAAVRVTSEDKEFAFHENGALTTAFELYFYSGRQGAEPDRLESDVADLALHVDLDAPGYVGNPTPALALAERVTGVHLSPAAYKRTALVGSTEHLDPYV